MLTPKSNVAVKQGNKFYVGATKSYIGATKPYIGVTYDVKDTILRGS